ncbi:MAG: hypothetical protein QM640_07065, partial [Niabella sp.]
MISRKVNGGVDEILVYGADPESTFSYYYNHTMLNRIDWYSQNVLNKSFAYKAKDLFCRLKPTLVSDSSKVISSFGGILVLYILQYHFI